MLKLEWKVNGRTVRSNRVADELGQAIRRAAIVGMKQAIAGVRCPVHGSCADEILVESAGENMNFTFSACCEELKQAIAARLRSQR